MRAMGMTRIEEHSMRYKNIFTTLLIATAAFTASCDTVFTDVYNEVSSAEIFVSGSITSFGGFTRSGLASFDGDSGEVTDFYPQVTGNEYSKMAIAGDYIYFVENYYNTIRVNRLNGTHTDLNSTDQYTYTIAADQDYVYIGGGFSFVGGIPRNGFAVLDAQSGSLVLNNIVFSSSVRAILPLNDVIFIGGEFTTVDGETRNSIAAIDRKTGALKSWDPQLNAGAGVYALALSGNTLYIGGNFTTVGGKTRNDAAAVDCRTGVVLPWNPNCNSLVYSFGFEGDTVYIGGEFTVVGPESRFYAAAVDNEGGSVKPWNPYINGGAVYSIAIHNGKVYLGGNLTTASGQTRYSLAAFTTDSGRLLPWIGTTALAQVRTIIVCK
jgi:trimeric autotransporter adhesin